MPFRATGTGESRMFRPSAEDPREFQVAIATIDGSGHLEVAAKLSQVGRDASASFECRFGLDPSTLPRVRHEFEIIGAAA